MLFIFLLLVSTLMNYFFGLWVDRSEDLGRHKLIGLWFLGAARFRENCFGAGITRLRLYAFRGTRQGLFAAF